MTEAFFGLLGVVVGSLIPWMKEVWSERRTRARHARYLAIRVVCALDKYSDKCVEIVQDDGLCLGQRNKDGYLEPQVSLPETPEYPEDVDWKSIGHDLMFALLALPNEAEKANRSIRFISSEVASPPDYEEYFEARHYEYAVLGLRAIELANKLRATYDIPLQRCDDWNPYEFLTQRKGEIDQQRSQRVSPVRLFGDVESDDQSLPEVQA